MKKAPITFLILELRRCFEQLQVTIDDKDLEEIAILIYGCMVGTRRKFHTLNHVFDVCESLQSPYQVLAGLFHDVVYYQVDEGFSPNVAQQLAPYITVQPQNQALIHTEVPNAPLWWNMLLATYGFKGGQVLNVFGGMNELLSTIVAMDTLAPFFSINQLIPIATCIEATIPFRGFDESGFSSFDHMAQRLEQWADAHAPQVSKDEIIQAVHLSVDVANEDVANFASENTGYFLENTWRLIYEGNVALNDLENHAYSVVKYREGLMKTEGFLRYLQTANIFHRFQNVPKSVVYARLTHQAQKNVAIAREYLATKLCFATLLEAFAFATGGDAPMSMLIGMMKTETSPQTERAEYFLTPLESAQIREINPKVLKLLVEGRVGDTGLEIKSSPIAAYIYQFLGTEGIVAMLDDIKKLFAKEISYEDFLATCPPYLRSELAKSFAKIAITRATALKTFF
ncbi:MAG: hypothetical protein EAZ55_03545 [Cytophagales bacterium]|nr:MAG: hypothetical protein EAZ55_03545 [Cytophagales bacterium]